MRDEGVGGILGLLRAQVLVRSQGVAIADLRQGRSALCAGQPTLTFAELEWASAQVAGQLWRAGLRSGEAALVLQPMSTHLYVVLLALFRLGAVAMFIDPAAGVQHLERCCAMYPPQALIASPKAHLLQLKSRALRQMPLKFSIGFPVPLTQLLTIEGSRLNGQAASAGFPLVPASAAALLTFTSGSTGQPKAALRSHEFLLAQHRVLAKSLSLTPGGVDLTTLPIFVLANLASGVTSLIPGVDLRYPGKVNGATVMRQIQRYQPTSTAASPAFLERLVDACDRHSTQLPSLQRVFAGGAPVFPRLLERMQAIAPQAQVTAVYGSTEAEPIAHIAYHELQPEDRTKMLSGSGLLVGHPVAELQLRLLLDQWGTPLPSFTQAEFDRQCLAAGAIGEIVVSGDHVLPGYLHGQGDPETKFRVDGCPWHRTGDAGYLDAEGRLWLLGRCSIQMQADEDVQSALTLTLSQAEREQEFWLPSPQGEGLGMRELMIQQRLYPFAVEAAAHHQPGVRRTALVWHQGRRVLLVEWEPQSAAKDLASLKRSLHWATIDEFRSCRQIPLDRRHNAKVDYPALYRLLEKR